jgi:hypothetical protein
MKKGYMYVNEVPGIGVDVNEKEAAKYPIGTKSRGRFARTTVRLSGLNPEVRDLTASLP